MVGLLRKILKRFTHSYITGKNNQIIFIKDGKETKKFFLPKGLRITIDGDNNKVFIEQPIKFSHAKISLCGSNNVFSIKKTTIPISDVSMFIGAGSEIYIDENASIGQGNFYLVANGNYKTGHKIVIGKNFRAGKDTIIRTSDGHSLINPETNIATNEPQDIIIGDNVWIMSRCMIAKGTKIPNNSAVAAYSFVNKKYDEENILLAGIPAKVLKHNIKWDLRSYGAYMRDLEKEQNKELI